MRRTSAMPWSRIFSAQRLLLVERQLGEAGSCRLRGAATHTPPHIGCARVIVSLLLLACGAKFSFAQEFEPREFEARAATHAGAGEAEARAERHARAVAGHSHRHHHINTTTAITTNTTPTTTTTTTTTTGATTTAQKPPAAPPPPGDPAYIGPGGTATAPNTGNWNTAGNWSPSGVPANGAALSFGGSGSTSYTSTNDITSYTLGSVSLTSTSSATETIAGNSFTVSGSSISMDNTGAFTISNAFNGTTNTTLTLTGNGTGIATLSGVISNSANTLSITKTGTSTFVLSGANTYSGITTISGGTLKLGSATALGAALGTTATGTSITGGTLDLNGQAVGNELITVNGTATIVNNSVTAASLSGGVTNLQTDTSIGGSGDLLLSGVVASSGNGDWTKDGAGKLTLTGNNTFTRALTINAGVVNIQNSGALGATNGNQVTVIAGAALEMQGGITSSSKPLTLNGSGISNGGALRNISGNNTYGNTIALNSASTISSDAGTLSLTNTIDISGPQQLTLAGAGNGSASGVIDDGTDGGTLTKTGAGTWTLSGANTYQGATKIDGGILNAGSLANGGSSSAIGNASTSAANLVFGGGTLQYTGSAAASTNRLFTIGDAAGNSATLDASGSGSGTMSFTGTGSIAFGNTSAHTLILTGSNTGANTLASVIGDNSGATSLTKSGAGTWSLSGTGANTYTGLTTVSAGELDLGKTATVNAIGSGGLSISGGTVKYTGTSTDEIANTANVTISGGTLDLNNHADTIGSLTFNSGTLTSTGGTQTLTLAGSTATTLQMRNTTIPSSVNLAFSSTTTSGVGMTFDASANGTATINGNINLNSTGTTGITRTFTINDGTAATDTTIAGVISNTTATGLTKAGAGTLVLTGANTYTGATTVNAGSLFVNNTTGSGTGTGNVTVNNSGTTLGGSGTITGNVNVASSGANLSPGASGVGSVGKLTTGAVTLAANSNFNIDITGAGGTGNAGSTYDQLSVLGTVNITGSNLLVSASNLTAANIGQQYFITLNDGTDLVTGTFAQGATVTSGSDVFLINYLANGDGGTVANDISLTLTAVPEPSTWLAAALALGAVGYVQRRRLCKMLKS